MTEDNQDPVTDNPDPQERVKFEGGNSSQKVTDITAIVEEVVRRLQGSNIATKPLSTRKRQQKKEVWEEDHEERLEQLVSFGASSKISKDSLHCCRLQSGKFSRRYSTFRKMRTLCTTKKRALSRSMTLLMALEMDQTPTIPVST